MNILHISDIHFCISYRESDSNYVRMLHKMKNPQTALKFCLRRALERYPADLLVITGDLTDDGTVEDYRRLRQIVRETLKDIAEQRTDVAKLPILVTPGNHDFVENLRSGWLGEPSSKEAFCDIYETADTAVLSFDSSSYGNPDGRIADSQIEWLRDQMEKQKTKQVVWITHHHMDPYQADISPVNCSEKFKKLLYENPPVCILNGHTHHTASGLICGVPYYTSSGMSFSGEKLADGKLCFREKCGYSWYRVENKIIKEYAVENFANPEVLDTFQWE